MVGKWLFAGFMLYAGLVSGQSCPTPLLTNPVNGAADVPVDTQISWNPVVGVPGYIISIGTTPSGTDIINRQQVGSVNTFTPPLGLPANTDIYVNITLFFFDPDIPDVPCTTQMFHTAAVVNPPGCTGIINPTPDATGVNVGTNITWEYSPTATFYNLFIGTAPGLADIVDNLNVGNVLSYNPPSDLPPNMPIYVRVVPGNDVGPAFSCPEDSFTTGSIAALPGCTSLITPTDGELNVPLTPSLEWQEVPGATGYRVTIGSSPFTAEVLDRAIFYTNATFVIGFEPNRTFFIKIVPFNSAGEAIDCVQESFSTILGCGPYFNPATGELVTLGPEINFPDTVSFCQSETPYTVGSEDIADGFRWFSIEQDGTETLLSDTREVALRENGSYRYEAYNIVPFSGGTIECPSSKLFEVVSSEKATITSLDITEQGNGIGITVQTKGIGDYEYAIDTRGGPYQESPVFQNIPAGSHTVYVRDKNGCGISEQSLTQELTLEGFPAFFTPNGDGINDFWQFIPSPGQSAEAINIIQIYDRYGRMLLQMSPGSPGWDGTLEGTPLPSSDYWFRAEDTSQNTIQGHFALKR
jgi:gliding motility-associated-like protein